MGASGSRRGALQRENKAGKHVPGHGSVLPAVSSACQTLDLGTGSHSLAGQTDSQTDRVRYTVRVLSANLSLLPDGRQAGCILFLTKGGVQAGRASLQHWHSLPVPSVSRGLQ